LTDPEILRRIVALEVAMRKPQAEVGGIGARVYNSVNISLVTSGAAQALTFDSERYDDANFHSTSVNTSRLTIPATGRYQIGANVRFANNVTGWRQLLLQVNGVTLIGDIVVGANAGGAVTSLVLPGVDWAFTAGDYIEILATQTSGGALNVVAFPSFSPEFWIHAI
jgi:hypothetical protein